MCKILEDLRNESEKRGEEREKKRTVRSMLQDGDLTLEKIAKISQLSLDEVKRLQAEWEM